jgi:hypothetical protein
VLGGHQEDGKERAEPVLHIGEEEIQPIERATSAPVFRIRHLHPFR